jgi:hypothetical protein
MLRNTLCLAFVLLTATFAHGDVAFPVPGADRIALADAIVVGRVMAIEPQDIEVGAENAKTKYRIAVVNVTETILGNKETKTIRVAFTPPSEKAPVPNRRRPLFLFTLDAGMQGLLYLRKHPTENLYVGTSSFDFVPYQDEKTPGKAVSNFGQEPYPQELKKTRRILQLLEKPLESLKSTDAADRATVAHNLLICYRTPKMGSAKTESVSLDESKLILSALLEQDWNTPTPTMNPWQRFQSLGLTENEGWKVPAQIKSVNDLRDAARAWYREHGDYRIQRYVAEQAK